ncbi:MAG: hypothetical protein ACK4ND_01410 [Cytophagaceae bacterium]
MEVVKTRIPLWVLIFAWAAILTLVGAEVFVIIAFVRGWIDEWYMPLIWFSFIFLPVILLLQLRQYEIDKDELRMYNFRRRLLKTFSFDEIGHYSFLIQISKYVDGTRLFLYLKNGAVIKIDKYSNKGFDELWEKVVSAGIPRKPIQNQKKAGIISGIAGSIIMPSLFLMAHVELKNSIVHEHDVVTISGNITDLWVDSVSKNPQMGFLLKEHDVEVTVNHFYYSIANSSFMQDNSNGTTVSVLLSKEALEEGYVVDPVGISNNKWIYWGMDTYNDHYKKEAKFTLVAAIFMFIFFVFLALVMYLIQKNRWSEQDKVAFQFEQDLLKKKQRLRTP